VWIRRYRPGATTLVWECPKGYARIGRVKGRIEGPASTGSSCGRVLEQRSSSGERRLGRAKGQTFRAIGCHVQAEHAGWRTSCHQDHLADGRPAERQRRGTENGTGCSRGTEHVTQTGLCKTGRTRRVTREGDAIPRDRRQEARASTG
jgi:hypothetical protein